MRHLLDELQWYETDRGNSRPPSSPEQLVDMENGYAVLAFTYRYLETHSRPPSDDEVHNVTATIAQYKGPRVVLWTTLESILAGLFTLERA
jgi:hypothetical protein